MQLCLPKSLRSHCSAAFLTPSPHTAVHLEMSYAQSAVHASVFVPVEPKSRQVLPPRLVPSQASSGALITPSPQVPTRHSRLSHTPVPMSGSLQLAPSATRAQASTID